MNITVNESSRVRTFLGANTLENESLREQKFPSFLGHFAKFQGARGPGSEWDRERIGQGSIGRFKLARE